MSIPALECVVLLVMCSLMSSSANSDSFSASIVEDYLAKRFASVEFTNVESSPYNVILFAENSGFFCTGTLITMEWVLSAAHCMYNQAGNRTEDHSSVLVVAGVSSLKEVSKLVKNIPDSSSTEQPPSKGWMQTRRSAKVEVCNLYKFQIPFMHDLVLVKVDGAFESTPYSSPVSLPTRAMTQQEHQLVDCDSTGFGKLLHFQASKHDYRIKLQKYDLSKKCGCFDHFEPLGLLYQNMWFCPINMDHVGLCDGDNGAPLVCEGLLRGVATTIFFYKNLLGCEKWPEGEDGLRKNDCGDINNLNLFTDLCVYGSWIKSFVPSYPVFDPSTCAELKFTWTEAGVDVFNPKTRVDPNKPH